MSETQTTNQDDVARERDALRAQVERVRALADSLDRDLGASSRPAIAIQIRARLQNAEEGAGLHENVRDHSGACTCSSYFGCSEYARDCPRHGVEARRTVR